MRKFSSFMAAAVAMLAAVSCNKEINNIDPVTPGTDAVVYTAYVDGAETKTYLGKTTGEGISKQTAALWAVNDAITIHNGETAYTFTTKDNATSAAKFEYDMQNGEYDAGEGVMAVYPATSTTNQWLSYDGSSINGVTLNSKQTATVNSYDPAAHIAVAQSSTNTLSFKNAISLFTFKVANEDVKSVKIYSNNGEFLSGLCSISAEGIVIPWTKTGEAESYVELTAGDGVFEVGKSYYIALFPTNSQNQSSLSKGFTVKFSFDGTTEKKVKSYEKSISLNRNKIYDLGILEYIETVVTPEQPTEWSIVGGFNSWVDKTLVTTTVENLLVAKGLEMKAAEGFLVRKPTTEWADKYGAGDVNYLKADNYIITSKDGADMCLEAAGVYDIYFNVETKAIYVMTAGTDYTAATQQKISGKEPVQEEPEVTEKTLYLKPNSNWTQSNARFAAYFFNNNGNAWVSMTDSDKDSIYEVNIPTGFNEGDNVIFCRMNPSTASNNWNNKWNQTGDLEIPTDGKNLFTVPDGVWDGSTTVWSVK